MTPCSRSHMDNSANKKSHACFAANARETSACGTHRMSPRLCGTLCNCTARTQCSHPCRVHLHGAPFSGLPACAPLRSLAQFPLPLRALAWWRRRSWSTARPSTVAVVVAHALVASCGLREWRITAWTARRAMTRPRRAHQRMAHDNALRTACSARPRCLPRSQAGRRPRWQIALKVSPELNCLFAHTVNWPASLSRVSHASQASQVSQQLQASPSTHSHMLTALYIHSLSLSVTL